MSRNNADVVSRKLFERIIRTFNENYSYISHSAISNMHGPRITPSCPWGSDSTLHCRSVGAVSSSLCTVGEYFVSAISLFMTLGFQGSNVSKHSLHPEIFIDSFKYLYVIIINLIDSLTQKLKDFFLKRIKSSLTAFQIIKAVTNAWAPCIFPHLCNNCSLGGDGSWLRCYNDLVAWLLI